MSDSNPFGDSSSDEDDGFFSYEKKDFHKKEKHEEIFEPSPPKRARKAGKQASTDDALSKLERRRERRQASKPYGVAAEDDDSDVEIVAEVAAAEKNKTTNNNKPVDLLDSSDDEAPAFYAHRQAPIAVMQRSGVARETCDSLAQARNAMFKLQQAQHYHAEDVYVPAVPAVQPVVLNVDSPAPAQPSLPRNLGPSIQLKLRTNQVINGKRSESSTMQDMSIRRMEPFQKLLERYQTQHNIVAAESSVKFSLDGERIDLLKTPALYDLEDDDIIEVLVTTLVVRSSSTTNGASSSTASTAHLGPQLELKVRTQEKGGSLTNDIMTIRANETLQKLMDKYKKLKKLGALQKVTFKFDGETMAMSRTPASYDMESEDMIDVVLK